MVMTQEQLHLLDLPTEVLVTILTPFPTHELLSLTLISAAAPEYKIILEAYHPSRRYVKPYLYCEYLGTDGLSSQHEGKGSLYHDCDGVAGRLGKLGSLYSRFRPENPDVEGTIPVRRIAGAAPNLSLPFDETSPTDAPTLNPQAQPVTPIYRNAGDGGAKKIVHTINLDSGELFGQFCAYGSLVRLSPRRGVYLSNVNIVEPGQGTIRVWRHWLVDRAQELYQAEQSGVSQELERSSTTSCPTFRTDPTILWTDYKKNVGLKLHVRIRGNLFLTSDDIEDEALACDLEISQLIVRTTHLLLAVENSVKAQSSEGQGTKAYITWTMIGSPDNNDDQ